MLDQLNERLMRAKERLRSKQKLESKLAEAQRLFGEGQTKCAALEERLKAEADDVKKLEGVSLTALFATVLGTKETKLDKERQEMLEARLKRDDAVETLARLKRDAERYHEELSALSDVDAEYEQLLEEKEALLKSSGDPQAEKLLKASEALADLAADKKELKEAMVAGGVALTSLELVNSDLESAKSWGTWDMVGGGLITTMAKHSRIDSARGHAHEAQEDLHQFQEELADAGQRLHVHLEIDGFSRFADLFFDGLIIDWVVQSKLHKASTACADAMRQVTEAIERCNAALQAVERAIGDAEEKRRALIEGA